MTVDFNLDDGGDRSAGLIFSLGIVDKLTPANCSTTASWPAPGPWTTTAGWGASGIVQKMAAAGQNGGTVPGPGRQLR